MPMDVNLKPGMVLGGTYRLVSVIGRGGMGEVWRASHERLPKDVAVKVLLHVPASGDTTNARFRREAEIASRLSHPNIVEVMDFNVLPEGVPYMVLELLHGTSLRDRLDQGPVSVEETAELVQQIGSALAAAHALGVVHRDLKPENIFLVEEPGDTNRPFLAKVLDFGISKILGNTALTMDREVLGTPYYMAPEQAAGRRDQMDGRTDQFALGCIAYEMLSGKLPFTGQTIMEVLGAILNGEPEPIERLVPGLPDSVVNAIHRALSKEPNQRFSHILEFSSAFCSFLGPRLASGASWSAHTGTGHGLSLRQEVLQENAGMASAATQMLSTGGNEREDVDAEASQTDPLAGTQASVDLVTGKTLAADSQPVITDSTQKSGPNEPGLPVTQASETGEGNTRWRLGRYLGPIGVLAVIGAILFLMVRPKSKNSRAPRPKVAQLPQGRKTVVLDAGMQTPSQKPSRKVRDAGPDDASVSTKARSARQVSGNKHSRASREPAGARHGPTTPRSSQSESSTAAGTAQGDPALLEKYRSAMAEARTFLRKGRFADALGQADGARRACTAARSKAVGPRRRRRSICSLSAAWKVYTMAACGLPDQSTAQSGFARLRGRTRKQVQAFCKKKGIVVGGR